MDFNFDGPFQEYLAQEAKRWDGKPLNEIPWWLRLVYAQHLKPAISRKPRGNFCKHHFVKLGVGESYIQPWIYDEHGRIDMESFNRSMWHHSRKTGKLFNYSTRTLRAGKSIMRVR